MKVRDQRIVDDDYIDLAELDPDLIHHPASLLYHGSLAARSSRVFDSIMQLQKTARISFVDINLRSPWWDMPGITRLIQGASWLKVNDDELMTLTGVNDELSAMAMSYEP